MTITPEAQAVGLANTIMSLAQRAADLSADIDACSSQCTNVSFFTTLNLFPTIVLTATGGLPGTPDGTPNTAHPINTGTIPGIGLAHTISAADIAGLMTYLQGVSSAVKGSAISANGAGPQLVAKVT